MAAKIYKTCLFGDSHAFRNMESAENHYGWMSGLNRTLGNRFPVAYCGAVGGKTSVEALAEQVSGFSAAKSAGCKIGFVSLGSNDIRFTNDDDLTIFNRVMQFATKLKGAGIVPLLVTSPPVPQWPSGKNAAQCNVKLARLRSRIMNHQTKFGVLELFGSMTAADLVDPTGHLGPSGAEKARVLAVKLMQREGYA